MVVVESAADAGKEPAAAITMAAQDLPDGITLVVAHSGGGRTKTMPATLKKAGARVHDCARSPVSATASRSSPPSSRRWV